MFSSRGIHDRFYPDKPSLTTITGVSGAGKTDFLIGLVSGSAIDGPIPFISLAHHRDEILGMSAKYAPGTLDQLEIHQRSDIDINYIERVARPGTPLLIDGFNYLEDFSRERGRNEEITAILRRLKRLALKIEAPVIETAMLSDFSKSRGTRCVPVWAATLKESSYVNYPHQYSGLEGASHDRRRLALSHPSSMGNICHAAA